MDEELKRLLADVKAAAESAEKTLIYALVGIAAFLVLNQYAKHRN